MTITYPLSFPTVGTVQSTFRLQHIVGSSRSIFTGARQVYRHQGEWWEGEVTFRPVNHVQVGQIKAFLAALAGQYGTFLYGDPDYLAKGANGTIAGTPLVNGNQSALSNTLATKGWTPSSAVFKKGDYFQLGSGSTARLHMVTEDATADGSGNVTLSIEPRLRASVLDNATITVADPMCVMSLVGNPVEWYSNQSSIYQVSLSFREALNL